MLFFTLTSSTKQFLHAYIRRANLIVYLNNNLLKVPSVQIGSA
jgi:hypothetical protein